MLVDLESGAQVDKPVKIGTERLRCVADRVLQLFTFDEAELVRMSARLRNIVRGTALREKVRERE